MKILPNVGERGCSSEAVQAEGGDTSFQTGEVSNALLPYFYTRL